MSAVLFFRIGTSNLVDKIFMLEVEVHLATFFNVRRCNLKWISIQLRCSISYLQYIILLLMLLHSDWLNKIQFDVPILKASTTERCTSTRLWCTILAQWYIYKMARWYFHNLQRYIFLLSVKLHIFMRLLFLPLISYA